MTLEIRYAAALNILVGMEKENIDLCVVMLLLLESTEKSNHSPVDDLVCLLGFVYLLQHFVLTHCLEQIYLTVQSPDTKQMGFYCDLR